MNPTTVRFDLHPSPIGELLLRSDGKGLTGLQMEVSSHPVRKDPSWRRESAPFTDVKRQLDDYFAGKRRAFELPLAPRGTPFQREVWAELVRIPFGARASYGEIARRIGRPRAVRAVGGANGRNPIAIVIPCHRVVGADGSLTGFGGGLERKRFLLDLERDPESARPPVPVAAAVVRQGERFLLGRRPAHKRHGGLWEFPGGKVGEEETLPEAVARELAEEMALRVTRTGATLFEMRDPGSPFLIRFVEVEVAGTPDPIEHQEIGWFTPEELREMPLAPSDARFVERLPLQAL